MAQNAKFGVGVLLHNRSTQEDGLALRMYQRTERGEPMYEVAIPILFDTWAARHNVSDWAESVLELSGNVVLKTAGNSPLLNYGHWLAKSTGK
jgi:hypothetical protein